MSLIKVDADHELTKEEAERAIVEEADAFDHYLRHDCKMQPMLSIERVMLLTYLRWKFSR